MDYIEELRCRGFKMLLDAVEEALEGETAMDKRRADAQAELDEKRKEQEELDDE